MKHENENDRITILDFYKAGSDNSVSWDGRYNHQCQTHSEGASLLTNTSTGPLYGIMTRFIAKVHICRKFLEQFCVHVNFQELKLDSNIISGKF